MSFTNCKLVVWAVRKRHFVWQQNTAIYNVCARATGPYLSCSINGPRYVQLTAFQTANDVSPELSFQYQSKDSLRKSQEPTI